MVADVLLFSPLDVLVEQAKKEETLVPIRIELEHEGYKLRDTFTWNLHGKQHIFTALFNQCSL